MPLYTHTHTEALLGFLHGFWWGKLCPRIPNGWRAAAMEREGHSAHAQVLSCPKREHIS